MALPSLHKIATQFFLPFRLTEIEKMGLHLKTTKMSDGNNLGKFK
jgi:hypothetical protein